MACTSALALLFTPQVTLLDDQPSSPSDDSGLNELMIHCLTDSLIFQDGSYCGLGKS